jgi:hypothetical protein
MGFDARSDSESDLWLTLTAPSTARGSSTSGRHLIGLDALEGAPLVENRPGDAGEPVGERNRQHVWCNRFLAASIQDLRP